MNVSAQNYYPRIADAILKRKLVSGAVLIEGAKWCGKLGLPRVMPTVFC